MNDLDQRKLLSVISHGSILFSSTILSIVIPITIFFKTQDDIVKQNTKETINFHINIYIIYAVLIYIIIYNYAVIVISLLLLILLSIASLIMPIIAIFKVIENPDKPYRYPFIFRLL
ncbi:MAG: DUF4870 domain-containing protein [Symploca sp. SIO2E9]|nr:DUF4870 domain-containing protein [Symploca sp. SIO2E9]